MAVHGTLVVGKKQARRATFQVTYIKGQENHDMLFFFVRKLTDLAD